MEHIDPLLSEAGQQFQSGQSTVAPLSDVTTSALSDLVGRGEAGSPLLQGAQRGLLDTIEGRYAHPDTNPHLRTAYESAAGLVRDDINSMFSKAGRFRSPAHQGILSRELSGLAGNIFGNAYEAERDRQFGGYGMAGGLAAQDYRDLQNRMTAGGILDVQNQRELDDPYTRIQRYLAIIAGVPQGTRYSETSKAGYQPGIMDLVQTAGKIGGMFATGGASAVPTMGSMFGSPLSSGAQFSSGGTMWG